MACEKAARAATEVALAASEAARVQAEAEVEVLRSALLPFAEYARSLPSVIDGRSRITDTGPALSASVVHEDFVVTFADLRRARTVMGSVAKANIAIRLAEAEALKEALGFATPWPITDVLTVLVDATQHLRQDHDCDCPSHERRKYAADAATQMIERLVAVLAQRGEVE
jgi:hypothetical protein